MPGPALAITTYAVARFGNLPAELVWVIGRSTTSAKAKKNNLVLNGASSFRELTALTGSLTVLQSQSALNATGLELVELARQAWTTRQVDLLDQTVKAILALPLDPRVQNVARYYNAYALRRAGVPSETKVVLDKLIDAALPQHRPRIVLALGNCHLATGDVVSSTNLYLEAARIAADTDPLSRCSAIRDLALVRSIRGDHKGSLADLERLFPVMRSFATSYPEDYRYYLNNLAYELGQVGRIEEARAAINVALRSPYADRFPDWAETAQEIETMRRRVFLPLVFAVGLPAALGVPAALGPEASLSVKASDEATRNLNVPSVTEDAARPTPRQQVEAEAAVAQPELQPGIQTSPARVVAPTHRRNLKTSFLIVLARVTCRRVAQEAPLRETLKPTFQTSGCAQSPSARAPPFLSYLF